MRALHIKKPLQVIILSSVFLCLSLNSFFDRIAFGQFDNARMREIYKKEIAKLPSLSVAATFKSTISQTEFDARYDRWVAKRLAMFMSLSDQEIDAGLKSEGLTGGRDTARQFYLKETAEGKFPHQDDFEAQGNHKYFWGDIQEIRSYDLKGNSQKVLQYGVHQPKLENKDPNRWVIREAEKKDGRGVLFSKSTVRLIGMLPVGCYHPTIEQDFSSEFGEFWDNSSKIAHVGAIRGNHVFIKKHPRSTSPRFRWKKDTWLISSFENPEESIIPEWIAHVNAPGKGMLSNTDVTQIVNAAHAIEESGEGLVPKGFYIIKLIRFESPSKLGAFTSYPRMIKYNSFVDWESEKGGLTGCWPLQSFRLDITAVTLNENEPPAISVEDGDSYYDEDLKIGWIIGGSKPHVVSQRSSVARLTLWLVTGLVMTLVVYFYVKR